MHVAQGGPSRVQRIFRSLHASQETGVRFFLCCLGIVAVQGWQ